MSRDGETTVNLGALDDLAAQATRTLAQAAKAFCMSNEDATIGAAMYEATWALIAVERMGGEAPR